MEHFCPQTLKGPPKLRKNQERGRIEKSTWLIFRGSFKSRKPVMFIYELIIRNYVHLKSSIFKTSDKNKIQTIISVIEPVVF